MCQRAVISPPQGCRIPPSLPMQIRKFFVYFGCNIVFFSFYDFEYQKCHTTVIKNTDEERRQ